MKSPLRLARERCGLTLKQVADAVSMDPGNLSRVERGEQMPSKELVAALVEHFGNLVTELQIIYPERFDPETVELEQAAADRRSLRERRRYAERRAAARIAKESTQ